MKQLTCEMCGGTDLMKQDGAFVCQNCGMKYSVEEAKKLMIEGTVEVKGSVETRKTAELNGIIELAKELYEDEDVYEMDQECHEKLLEYCNEGLKLDSHCKELLKIKANVYMSREGYESKAIGVLKKLFKNEKYDDKLVQYVIDFVNRYKAITDGIQADRQRFFDSDIESIFSPNLDKLNMDSSDLACSIYRSIIRQKMSYIVYMLHKSGMILSINELESDGAIIGNSSVGKEDLIEIKDIENRILEKDNSYKISDDEIIVYERIIESKLNEIREFKNDICNRVPFAVSKYEDGVKSIDEAVVIIKRLQQTDSLPIEEQINQLKNEIRPQKKSGCYVATCVYGSYNCPQVWTLRRYRDNTLAKTWYGRAFIHTYYAISPTIVKWFGNTTWFKKLWRGKLDKMVKKLNNDGISNTLYEDRSW